LFDAHIHLEQYQNLDNQITRWKIAGASRVVAVSNNLASSYRTLELQMKYPDFVHAAVGFHPERPLPTEADFIEWQTLLKTERNKITAIGEIGLPHYALEHLPYSFEHYIEFLSRCLDIAHREDLPVVLHAVHDKAMLVYELLQENHIKRAHFHWLKAPLDVLDLIVNTGYYVSVTPEICYRNRDQQLASLVPLSQLLIETDGPWQFDHPFDNQLTTPLLLKDIINKLSDLKGLSWNQIQQETTNNTIRCYNLDKV
jgi:TatD DNase family protein